jgi:hypothetical protein
VKCREKSIGQGYEFRGGFGFRQNIRLMGAAAAVEAISAQQPMLS